MNNRRRLLINWIYYRPIGHAIEAFRLADAFRNENPDLEVGVLINSTAGIELADCLPQIDNVFGVNVSAFGSDETGHNAFEEINPEWDYVLTDTRHDRPMGWHALDRCEQAFRAFIRPKVTNNGWDLEGFPPRRYRPLELQLPHMAKSFARGFVTEDVRTRISILLGSGTEPNRTPSMVFWRQLCQALIEEFGDVEIILLGALRGKGSRTKGINVDDINSLVSEFSQVRDGFDKGLLNQLAIAETCDLHISPHTGMSFAVQSVGVPWLILSGAWPVETVLNGVPFYAVFPECEQYPCGPFLRNSPGEMLAECEVRKETGKPFLCLTQPTLSGRMPELLRAARQLAKREMAYHECLNRHYKELLPRLGRQPGEWFFDGGRDIASENFIFGRVGRTSKN